MEQKATIEGGKSYNTNFPTEHWSFRFVKTRKNKRKFHNMIARFVGIIETTVTPKSSKDIKSLSKAEKESIIANQISQFKKKKREFMTSSINLCLTTKFYV